MEVILLESFNKLGKIGDVVNVKDGFARNYLIPQKKALRANKENKDHFTKIKKELIEKGLSFNSRTDTEVLLNSYKYWGENCLQKLEGMFAFAIYDKKKNIILLARDKSGEKPHLDARIIFKPLIQPSSLNPTLYL